MSWQCLLLFQLCCLGGFLTNIDAQLSNNEFISLFNMFTDERRARKEVEHMVHALNETVVTFMQETNAGCAVNQTCVELDKKYEVLRNRYESDITALQNRLQILEGNFTTIQNENDDLKLEFNLLKNTEHPVNNGPTLNTKLQTMSNELQQLQSGANTMKQEFNALSNSTLENKYMIQALQSEFAQRIYQVTQNLTQDNAAQIQSLENEFNRRIVTAVQNLTQITEDKIKSLERGFTQKISNIEHNLTGNDESELIRQVLTAVKNDSEAKIQTLETELTNKLTTVEQNLKQDSETKIRSLESDLTKKMVTVQQNLTEENEAKMKSLETGLTQKIQTVEQNLTQNTKSSIQSLEHGLIQEIHGVERNLTQVDAYIVLTAKSGRQRDYHVGQVIEFPAMMTSYGIDNLTSFQTSGIFRTETPGLYLISVRIQAFISLFYVFQDIHAFEIDIKKNSQTFSKLHIEYSNVTVAEDTTVVVTHLYTGDEITIVNNKKQMTVDADSTMTIVKIK